jgi:hypothetical protein
MFINKDVSDKKLIRWLKIWQYSRFTDEGWIYSFAGKPGVHFDWQGEPWDSAIIRKDIKEVPEEYTYGNNTNKTQLHWAPPNYGPDKWKFMYPKRLANFLVSYIDGGRAKEEFEIRPYKWDLFDETDLFGVYDMHGEVLSTLFEEFSLKAITGEIDIDAEWDDYVTKWLENGGEKVVAELEKAPVVPELLKGNLIY